MPKLTIDGNEIEAEAGQTVIDVAHQNGISIGHYCWHPGLSPEGNCRMCLVEVEKAPKLMPSCMTQVAEGMVVRTEHVSEKVRVAQRDVMEFLLVDHPIDCPICDQVGECKLQEYYMAYDRQPSRVPLESKIKKPKRVHFSENVIYDGERCILCSRCVRFCREVGGKEELGIINRGAVSLVALREGGQLTSPYSINIVDICPVGALTHADFRFRKRVYFLEKIPSICAGCSRGCNITAEYHHDEVYRYRPRENQAVNQWWMCDEGRMSYRVVHAEGRTLTPRLRSGGAEAERADWRRVLGRTADVLALIAKREGAGAVAALASPLASTEENWLLKKLFASRFPEAKVGFPPADLYQEGKADGLLRTGELSPNAAAGEALGLSGVTLEGILEGIEKGRVKALYLLGDDLLAVHPTHPGLAERFEKALGKLQWLAAQSPFEHATARRAHALLPSAHHLESEGTFINVTRRVQRFRKAVRPASEARPGIQILQELGHLLGTELPAGGAPEIFGAMAGEEQPFGGLTWEELGEGGATLGA